MSDAIIGTSQAAIDTYEAEALSIFGRINERMQLLVTQAFALVYEGPDAETVFNPGLVTMAVESVGSIDQAMTAFAGVVSAAMSNVSRSLGAGDIEFVYTPPPLELPPPPGVAADDYRIDVAGFNRFLDVDLVDAQTGIATLLADNQAAFAAIPYATASTPGWSGASRDHIQNVVVPTQTERLQHIVDLALARVREFLTQARDGSLNADAAGAALN
ncbi:MAG: hypothetical protein ACK5PP_10525 [Acidimicrobiales bacterium]